MAKGPENRFRDNKLRPLLDKLPLDYFIKEAGNLRGLPDIMGVIEGGKFFALEVKKDEKEKEIFRTRLQEFYLNRYAKRGAFTSFIYPDNAREVMINLLTSSFSAEQVQALMPLLDEYFPPE